MENVHSAMEIDLQEIHASTKVLSAILKMQLKIEGFLAYTSFCKMTSDETKHASGGDLYV